MIVTHDLASTTGKVYMNGQFVGSNTSYGAITYNSLDIRIGNWAAGGRNFNGKIDDVRIYNRILSATEAETPGYVGPVFCSVFHQRRLKLDAGGVIAQTRSVSASYVTPHGFFWIDLFLPKR